MDDKLKDALERVVVLMAELEGGKGKVAHFLDSSSGRSASAAFAIRQGTARGPAL